jgi:PAS domain-containing protein
MNPAAHGLIDTSSDEGERPVEEWLQHVRMLTAQGRTLLPDETPMARAIRGEMIQGETFVLERADGRTFWLYASAAPIQTGDHGEIGAVIILTDITAQHDLKVERSRLLARERALRADAERQMAQLSALVRSMTDGVTIIDAAGQIIVRNQGSRNITG